MKMKHQNRKWNETRHVNNGRHYYIIFFILFYFYFFLFFFSHGRHEKIEMYHWNENPMAEKSHTEKQNISMKMFLVQSVILAISYHAAVHCLSVLLFTIYPSVKPIVCIHIFVQWGFSTLSSWINVDGL